MYDFSNKFVLVTGAAQGIGLAIARRFVTEHASGVALIDYNQDSLNNALAELESINTDSVILPVSCDVSNYENLSLAINQIIDRFGRIDILINNAGITRDAIFHKMSLDQWNDVININLNGVFNCTRLVINGMRENNYGKIVNMSSKSAYGEVGQANYAATKAALVGFTKTLAKEGARKNITVNAVLPDFIDTPMMNAIPQENLQRRIEDAPMKRMGKPEEV